VVLGELVEVQVEEVSKGLAGGELRVGGLFVPGNGAVEAFDEGSLW
jgi:hypothetical protein